MERTFRLVKKHKCFEETKRISLPENFVGDFGAEEELVLLLADGGDVAGPGNLNLRGVYKTGNSLIIYFSKWD